MANVFSEKCLGAARAALIMAAVLCPGLVTSQPAQAQTFKVLYAFQGGSDGANPYDYGTMVLYKGNLYGTTTLGGASTNGTVFQVNAATGSETVLYSFTGGTDGINPFAGLIRDSAGNLYGTTNAGGAQGDGTVFQVNSTGTLMQLHSFTGADGYSPNGPLVRDTAGDLYGTTEGYTTPKGGGVGTVFKLDTAGTHTTLHRFKGRPDGADPQGGLILYKGDLYGTTIVGGTYDKGTIFKVSAKTGKEAVLYGFTGGSDGSAPAGLISDGNGNLYGTTEVGGNGNGGVIFEYNIAASQETVLYSFILSEPAGEVPYGPLVRDSAGNLYGTTTEGGAPTCVCGTVFELDTAGNLITLHTFTGKDGSMPYAGLVRAANGALYGVTAYGGPAWTGPGYNGAGVVFEVKP